MVSKALNQKIEEAWDELREHRKGAALNALLRRFIVETGIREEFLTWLAKDMGLDKPMDLTGIDEQIEMVERSSAPGQ